MTEQMRNTRATIRFTYRGKRMTLPELCAATRRDYFSLRLALIRYRRISEAVAAALPSSPCVACGGDCISNWCRVEHKITTRKAG
jgi:hypothetical protein